MGVAGRGLGAAADVAAIPIMINQAGDALNKLPRQAQGPAAVAAPAIIGGAGLLAAGATVGWRRGGRRRGQQEQSLRQYGSAASQEAPKPGWRRRRHALTPTQAYSSSPGPDGETINCCPDGKPIGMYRQSQQPQPRCTTVTPGNLPWNARLVFRMAKEPAPVG